MRNSSQGFHQTWVNLYHGPNYDVNDTRSINSLLGHTRKKDTGR